MAIDTEDKRRCVMNITTRTFVGLTPDGSIDQDDKENYAWLYFPFVHPAPSVGVEEMYIRSIDCTVGCKL